MSHSQGKILFEDGTKYFFEYNGTVDVCLPKLYLTVEALMSHWRNQTWEHHDKSCENSEPAKMATTYGGGLGWNVMACKTCMLITDWHSHDSYHEEIGMHKYEYQSDLPEWYNK